MNILQVVSLMIATGVFLVSVLTSTDDPKSMLDFHGMMIVLGGTLGAGAVSFQLDRVLKMVIVFWNRNIRGKKPDYIATIRELMHLADLYRVGSGDLKARVERLPDPFLKECMTALLDQVFDTKNLLRMLRLRSDNMYERYRMDAGRFTGMGKYPPAMGLMGAVLGMIALLGSLGKPGAEDAVGPAMSVALIATFYGIALANLVIIPIGENLTEAAKEMKIKNNIIVEGIKLIAKKTNPIVLAEELNSYLLPGERLDPKAK